MRGLSLPSTALHAARLSLNTETDKVGAAADMAAVCVRVVVAARSAPCRNHTTWCLRVQPASFQLDRRQAIVSHSRAGANPELATHTWNTSYSNVFQISSCWNTRLAACVEIRVFGIPAYSPALTTQHVLRGEGNPLCFKPHSDRG